MTAMSGADGLPMPIIAIRAIENDIADIAQRKRNVMRPIATAMLMRRGDDFKLAIAAHKRSTADAATIA